MSLTETDRERNRAFKAALAHFGLTRAQWSKGEGFALSYLHHVLTGVRSSAPRVIAAMDRTIQRYRVEVARDLLKANETAKKSARRKSGRKADR